MTLSYQDIVTADLSPILSASEGWQKTGNEYGTLQENYKRHVADFLSQGSWRGEAFIRFVVSSDASVHELGAAKAEAHAFAGVLEEAHAQLTQLQKRVKDLATEAEAAGFSVDGAGHVTYDWDALSETTIQATRNDPDTMRLISQRTVEWNEAIETAVQAVEDADAGVKTALMAAATDQDGKGDSRGFNSDAEEDMEVAEAERAVEIAEKYESGEKLSDAEMAEWQRLLRDNADDREFAETYLKGLGEPEDLLRLHERLGREGIDGDKGRSGQYEAVSTGLANVLATATAGEGPFAREYVEGLKEVGRQEFGIPAESKRGYQLLVGLMEKADPNRGTVVPGQERDEGSGFDPDLLQELGDDIIAFEREQEAKESRAFDFGGRPAGGAYDPLDGLLGIMARDPEVATEFLDPNGQEENNLKYLLNERRWPEGMEVGVGTPAEGVDPSGAREGLGEAMVAATRDTPGEQKSAQAVHDRILDASIDYLAAEGDDFPPELRKPMAEALTHQALDVNQTMSGRDTPAEERQLYEVTKQVARNQEAYHFLSDGMNGAMVYEMHAETDDPERSLRWAGQTLGFMEEARYEAIIDDKGDASWDAKMNYHTFGAAANAIPWVGDVAQRGVDIITSAQMEDEQRAFDQLAEDESFDTYQLRKGQADALAEEWLQANREWAQEPEHFEYDDKASVKEKMRDEVHGGQGRAEDISGRNS